MGRMNICFTLLAIAIVAMPAPQRLAAEEATEANVGKESVRALWRTDDQVELSFEEIFSKPLYKKSYFPAVIVGTGIVVAGVVSYLTAGAGAPAAATGVSTVASLVGGGGQGSYMAGLSIVGGWFGGNAMLGAAILNGISLGTVGGTTAWAVLPAAQKATVVATATAAAMDGVLLFAPAEGKRVVYQIRLTVPQGIGSEEINDLADKIAQAEANAREAYLADDKQAFTEAADKHQELLAESRSSAQIALDGGGSPQSLIVLAVLNKNAGEYELFDQLIRRIPEGRVSDSGYLDYLHAVAHVEREELDHAERLLWRSWRADPYAIEPPLLLVNILGYRNFSANEEEILFIADRAAELFEDNEYETIYSTLALNYRLATLYYDAERYLEAQRYYERAYKEIPWSERAFGAKIVGRLVKVSIANSMYGQGKTEQADEMVRDLIEDVKTEQERCSILLGYAHPESFSGCSDDDPAAD